MQVMHYTMNLLNEVMRPLDESKETLIKWLDAKWAAAVAAYDAAMADDERFRDSMIIQAVLEGIPSPGRYNTINTIVASALDLHRREGEVSWQVPKSPFFENCAACGEKHMTSHCTASGSAMVAFQRTKIQTLKLKYPGDSPGWLVLNPATGKITVVSTYDS
eukprot:jgi/Tetstr1/455155/TSEL_042005.t1